MASRPFAGVVARAAGRARPGARTAVRQHRGVALITVLLVIALATIAATDMTRRGELDRRRTANRLALEQAHQVALGAERWAAAVLGRDARGESRGGDEGGDPDVDSRDENWAQVLPPIPIEGGQVTGRIVDAQGRFNLNSLVGPDDSVNAVALGRFERMLTTLGIEPTVAQAVIDWTDRNGETTYPGGGEDGYYAALQEPYRVANGPVAVASELRLMRGIDAESWSALAPHVTALPGATPINVNTATARVLQAVVEGLDADTAQAIRASAEEEPFESVDEFLQHPAVRDADVQTEGLSVTSSHFRLQVDVAMGPLTYTLYSWLERGENGASSVLRRSRTPS